MPANSSRIVTASEHLGSAHYWRSRWVVEWRRCESAMDDRGDRTLRLAERVATFIEERARFPGRDSQPRLSIAVVELTSVAARQLLSAREWWLDNRDKAPEAFDDEIDALP